MPVSFKDTPCTLSFYAKASQDHKNVRICCDGQSAVIPLSTEWKRYDVNWHLSYNRYGNNLRFFAYNHDMTMWINGIQIEKGDETTEFLDDTMRIVEQLRQGK